jgi:hypothetical protein
MKTLVWTRWRNIDNPAMEALPFGMRVGEIMVDNPAMEALPFGMRVGEIMEGRAFLGY